MSILINGISLPKDGGAFIIYSDGDVRRFFGGEPGTVGTAVEIHPNGDLIERDALSKSLNRLCDRVCKYSKAQRKVMCVSCPLGDAFAVVEDDAPPIIPAEEE